MKRFMLLAVSLVFFTATYAQGQDQADAPGKSSNPCAADTAPLLNTLFSSLGHDCTAYSSLFANEAKYFHQHDGYKSASELQANCEAYATFCPADSCKFLQNGDAVTVARGDRCHMLVPYVWAEMPANSRAKDNLEPHTGWEYIVTTPDSRSQFGYKMTYFAEIETSYSVAFNWATPEDTPVVVAQSALHLLSLANSASRGECNNPIAPTLTNYFKSRSRDGETWRQQGDAVVLAAGDLCHVAVPYAAQVGETLKTGHFIFTLLPGANTYRVAEVVEFPRNL